MASGYIQVATDGTGKKMQTFRNTVGADSVDAEAVVLVDSTGAVIATIPVSIAAAVAVTGTFWQATQPVSGTFWQATQPVSIAAIISTKETRAATPAQSSVANSASSVTLLAANANRLGATIFNDDTAGTGATLKVKLGATASATSFTVAIAPQGYYEVPFNYTGIIDAIASAATGNARITELS